MKIFLIKKRDYFCYFSFTKISLKKTLLRYPFYNNNFIFANKRNTKIVILSIILVFLFIFRQRKRVIKKNPREVRGEKRNFYKYETKPKINVE